MKKKVLFSLCFVAAVGLQAQVGINNTDSKALLHITPRKRGGTSVEGRITPNLIRRHLIGKNALDDAVWQSFTTLTPLVSTEVQQGIEVASCCIPLLKSSKAIY